MSNRYRDRPVTKNDLEEYKEIFKQRNVKFISQYLSPHFINPSEKDLSKLEIYSYTWKNGDTFHKLAYTYYGDVSAWWVIARFNNKPTEANVAVGDKIYIPTPLPKVMNYMLG